MLAHQTHQWQGRSLGRYLLLSLLGRGGMGEVWQAEDTQLHRHVAIKLLLPVLDSEKEYLDAFHNEARLAASLNYPHILSVHDFGELHQGDDVITYLVMPFLNGGTLRNRMENLAELLPTRVSLHYLRQAAEAIDYAHSRQVLHRDVTPSNMLLQDDQLYLSDFGIARLLSTSTYHSRTSVAVGTPEYMAPERIQEKAVTASDLYSLAVIAYQLFTGRLPFEGEDALAVLLKHIQEPPPSPRQFQPQLPEEAAQLLLTALSKHPEERPSNCVAFVEALEQSLQTRQPSHVTKADDPDATLIAPWNKRAHNATRESGPYQTLPVGIASTLNLAIPNTQLHTTSTGQALETTQTQVPSQARKRAHVNRRAFMLGVTSAAVFLAGSGLALGSSLYRSYGQVPGPQQLHPGRPLLKLNGLTDIIWNVRWHPRGRYLATAGYDNLVQVWDLDASLSSQGHTPSNLSHASASWKIGATVNRNSLTWSPDGHALALFAPLEGWAGSDAVLATVDVFQPRASLQLYTDPSTSADRLYRGLSWSPSNQVLATGTRQGNIALWHPGTTHGVFKRFTNPEQSTQDTVSDLFDAPPALCWSHDEQQILEYFQPNSITSWNVQTGQRATLLTLPRRPSTLPEKPGQKGIVYFLTFLNSPTSPTQFLASDVDIAIIFDTAQKKVLSTLGCADPDAHRSVMIPSYSTFDRFCPQLGQLTWSPNGRYIASTYLSSNQIFVWDLHNTQPHLSSDGHHLPELAFGKNNGHSQGEVIVDLAWSPDGRYIASSATDGIVLIWQVDGA
ncbi:WD40 repeat domain-containing serine/threonine protein kinase [Ktedonobacter robiniae]|uniref:non-specific serine/threonine protein kinase n=1 Tax=Ktedonobacter robiniae TaxID=2778365 RepID=A0ABQ3UGH7_9CHLR|nr:serine/threonine-protein kinase [Ktedonobacter robiniae]GHO51797.1 hypothetical protein KSB_02720 [Ktedonobacter robiniae]